ncbi:MarR family winged helix-turn-helix transcriptional regulator [Companilactobacillus insicii]|uniref:MarR family winged helix-turn-helix transcriptional regulator n=1 Tax=Companilactobacillus insicii TaxID=1732567 RepID=UPI000F771302|nr:MarR family transcriptional regulator [Companilactobacillus insicii]
MSKLTDDLMKQLRFISEASNNFMHQKKQRLTGQQRVLAILRLEDGLSQRYLTEVLDLRPSSVAELLKKLETNGDILRKEDENDKRTKLVYLTDSGRKKAEDNASLKDEDYSETFFAGLNDEDQKIFSDNLTKIANGWDEDFKQKADKFVDPMDRMQQMQKVHESMMEKFGDDWQDMSPEDMRHQMRKQMRKAMKDGDLSANYGMGFMPGMMMGRGCDHHMGHRPSNFRF